MGVGEVKERTVSSAREVRERAEALFGKAQKEQENERSLQKERSPVQAPSAENRLDELLAGLDRKLDAQKSIDTRLAALDQRLDAQEQARKEQLSVISVQQDQEIGKKPEQEHQQSRGFGLGM